MWLPVAKELGMPWRTVEAMHWEMGERELVERARGSHFPDRNHRNALPGVEELLSKVPPSATLIASFRSK